jgi:hypothetical protein
MGDERAPGRLRETERLDSGAPGRGEEALRERQDVLAPARERRHLELDHRQAIVEVLAEAAGGDGAAEVGVRRGDDPHVDLDRLRAAQPLEPPGLNDAQQLGLSGGRQVADLVEQERARARRLEAADPAPGGAGVGAGLGAEQLGLEQRLR